jgi:hypothetical protein
MTPYVTLSHSSYMSHKSHPLNGYMRFIAIAPHYPHAISWRIWFPE